MSKRSERKRREEEARRQQELARRRQMMMQQRGYAQQQQPMGYNMGAYGMNYGPMNGTNATPCAMPSRFIQLTPIIQPIAMVPYSTQNQPLMMYGNPGDGFDDFSGDDDFF